MKNRMLSISLAVVLALSAGLIGCAGEGVPEISEFNLTISGMEGGSVTTPGEGTFTYDEGVRVDLVAQAEENYHFVNWTGDVSTIGDVDSATTTIIMNDDYSITGNFARQQYDLTTASTAGGSITMPGEGTFRYDEGTVVNLVAEADDGHKFVNWIGDVGTVQGVDAAQTTITINGSYSIGASFERKYIPMVAAGLWHTVGLKSDGTVVAVGSNKDGQCHVGDWTDIVQIAGGGYHTVGLKSDGTVVAVGSNENGQCNVDSWKGIIQIDAGKFHTVALTANGSVVATGWNGYGQCDVSGWTDIIQVSAGYYHTVGLRSDGTVAAVGVNYGGELEVGEWTDIILLDAGAHHTAGLRSDGTVVAVGRNEYKECSLDDWTDIVQVSAGCRFTVGLKPDGTVVARGLNQYYQCEVGWWSDIVQVDAGFAHTVGLKYDGSVVAIGINDNGRCEVDDWMLT